MNIIKRIFVGVVSLSIISAVVLGFTSLTFLIFGGDGPIVLRVAVGIIAAILVWMLGESSIKIGVTDDDGGERNHDEDRR